MNPENITEIIKNYLKKSHTQYALLINGSWGSGKTFFWKNTLIKQVKDSKLKVMYVSLNGVSSIEKLEQLIFLQLIPKLDKSQGEIMKNLTTVSKNIANATTKFFFKSDLTDLVKGSSVKAFGFQNHCICFDDLERCKIPIDELFGYLSDFIEHKHLKCILLADEQKIKDQEKNQCLVNGYEVIKEKIIGRVLNYDPNLEEVIPLLINCFNNDKLLYEFLKNHSDFFIDTFKNQNIKNLRIINFYFECIETVYPILKSTEKAYVIEGLFLMAILSIEFKEGRLESKDSTSFDDFQAIDANWYSMITSDFLSSKKHRIEKEKSKAELFYEKYLMSSIDKYQFYPSLYTYILSGYFDYETFKTELKVREPEKITEEIASFRKLLNYKFRELDDNEFKELFIKVYNYAKKGVYWLYDYKQITNFFIYFSKNGLIEHSEDIIVKDLISGIKISSKRKEIHNYTFENLIHFANGQPETQQILDNIIQAHRNIQKEHDDSKFAKVILLIKDEKKTELAHFFSENKFDKDFLPTLDIEEFVNLFSLISNDMIFVLSELFKQRYDYSNPEDMLSLDLSNIEALMQGVNTYHDTVDQYQPIRLHNLKEFKEVLKEVIVKLSKK